MTRYGRHIDDQRRVDNELSFLLTRIRRHIHEAPPGTWDDETLKASRTLYAKVAGRLGNTEDGRSR